MANAEGQDFFKWLASGGKPTIGAVMAAAVYSTWIISGKVKDVENGVQRVNERLTALEVTVAGVRNGHMTSAEFDRWVSLFKALNDGKPITIPSRP